MECQEKINRRDRIGQSGGTKEKVREMSWDSDQAGVSSSKKTLLPPMCCLT
jgi:hypothetical protein